MSVWIDRIQQHNVWETLKELGASIDVGLTQQLTVDGIAGLERLKTVLAFTGKRLAATDPFLLSETGLDRLEANITAIIDHVDNFVSESEELYITNANKVADEVLVQLGDVLAPIPSEDLTVINESISEYRNTLDSFLQGALNKQSELQNKITENQKALEEQGELLDTEQARLATLLADYQTTFSANQDSRASEYATAMSDFQTQFSTAQIAIQEKVGALISNSTEKLNQQQSRLTTQQDKAGKSYKDDLAKLRVEYEVQAKKLLDEIVVHRQEVEELVGIIGNLGVTSGYLTEANTARKRLYFWQGLTVAALVFLICIAYSMAFPPPEHFITSVAKGVAEKASGISPILSTEFMFYQGLATRIFLSITLGVLAAYSGTQAEKYMEMDRRNRKLALELAAVGAYIAPLPIEMQNKFRAELGEKSFGVAEPSKKGKDPVTALDVLKSKEVEDLVSKLWDIISRKKVD